MIEKRDLKGANNRARFSRGCSAEGPRLCLCGCGMALPEGSNRGERRKFLNRQHKVAFERAARQVGAVTLSNKVRPPARKRPRGPSKRAQAVSQAVFLALVPVAERAELIRQAAEHLGISNQDQIAAAMRRAAVPACEATA